MSTENDSLIGKQLGAYQIQANLGEGGMARVYKAYHPRLRREVAIKVILSQIAERQGFQARFEQEAQVIANLEHPNIVSVYDFGEEGNLTYLVMQYVGGGILRDQLRGARPIETPRAVHYTIQMARALHHAHQRGIVHRDVKPQNMLISSTDSNHLLLSDFGIAKLFSSGEDSVISDMPTRSVEQNPQLTSVDQIIGTADYMSPEQVTAKPVDARTDVYALGVVLYQMLTGEVPFHSNTLSGLLFQHVYTPAASVREKNPHIPEILAEITSKALAKAPADRFQTAEAMAQALEYANMNATNPLASLALSHLTTMPYPLSGPSTQQTTRPPQQWPATGTQNRQDSYATLDDDRTITRPRTTSTSGTALPNTSPGITGAPISLPARKRQFPLSYMIAAAVLILSVVVFGSRFLLQSSGSGNTPNSSTGQARAFVEDFHDNGRNWPTGNPNPGVTASSPGGGAYRVTISPNTTAFPGPQSAGTLPDTFTLTASIQVTQGKPDASYGLAFHLSEDSSHNISCYALIVDGNGNYQILKYTTSSYSMVFHGSYTPNPQTQELKVQAQGSQYSFFVNGTEEQITIGNQSASTTWSDDTFHSGQLALLLGNSNTARQDAIFVVTRVQLSI
ncbi:MAG TPA: serine/threonine-protein kinase [Ktedonobacteraceae bacterium]|nr:serine/threonine-protein kinase [Ktedonobacteraceae bacterium]